MPVDILRLPYRSITDRTSYETVFGATEKKEEKKIRHRFFFHAGTVT